MYNHLACYGGWECIQCTDKPAREIQTFWNQEIMCVLVDGDSKCINTSNHLVVHSQTNTCLTRISLDLRF